MVSLNCLICKKDFKSLSSLQKHIKTMHKEIKIEDYYDKNISKEKRPKCVFCGEKCSFIGFTKGYKKICNNKECVSKSRATYTIEYGMKMENLTKFEAQDRLNSLNKDRCKTYKKTIKVKLEENPDFNKERSHQCVEYWLKRGYDKKQSKKKVEEVLEHLHDKTWEKRRNNPDLYQDINTTQIGYWLKKGFSKKEAKEKIKERQRTFTLKKCIIKYGEEKGTEIYNERNRKWSELMEEKYLNGEYTRFGDNFVSKVETELIDEIIYHSSIEETEIIRQYRVKINRVYNIDFKYKNKLIEFFGDYWHCNPSLYENEYFHKNKDMFAYEIWNYDNQKIKDLKSKFDVLVVWENEYKENPDDVIEKCIKFLNE
jgi:hypothetical protein